MKAKQPRFLFMTGTRCGAVWSEALVATIKFCKQGMLSGFALLRFRFEPIKRKIASLKNQVPAFVEPSRQS